MSIKMHERVLKVQKAQATITCDLIQAQNEHELTDIEMLQCINQYVASKLKYMLRYERHGDMDKPADEA